MKNNPFAFMRSKIEEAMPEALRPINAEIKSTTRRFIQERLSDFDLVPRQEFEQQQQLLAQAQQRIEALEKRLSELTTTR